MSDLNQITAGLDRLFQQEGARGRFLMPSSSDKFSWELRIVFEETHTTLLRCDLSRAPFTLRFATRFG